MNEVQTIRKEFFAMTEGKPSDDAIESFLKRYNLELPVVIGHFLVRKDYEMGTIEIERITRII